MWDIEIMPFHREIMTELRAIREQMGKPAAAPDAQPAVDAAVVNDAPAQIESYRAQIEQCEKLKVELDLIHEAISRTKREIAVLHGKSFNGDEMDKVNG